MYYNNRKISQSLPVNIARWKRWSREFLPPDPLGGLQSGYARQYSMREAFLVALGGHLVGFMKYSVHQARIILRDIDPWLKKNGFFQWNQKMLMEAEGEKIKTKYAIYIQKGEMKGRDQENFGYAVVSCLPSDSETFKYGEQSEGLQIVEFINSSEEMQRRFFATPFLNLLLIGRFRKWFLSRLHSNV